MPLPSLKAPRARGKETTESMRMSRNLRLDEGNQDSSPVQSLESSTIKDLDLSNTERKLLFSAKTRELRDKWTEMISSLLMLSSKSS
jgi:hypothetical protein